MKKEITESGIFECEDRMFSCMTHDGKIYIAEVLIVSPRNQEEAGEQAFNELQDAGILDE
jgi:hypothetical protein